MSDFVSNLKKQTWVVKSWDGLTETNAERFPWDSTDENAIIKILEDRAKAVLTEREVKGSPGLWQAQRDFETGKRLSFSAGENPHFTADLWIDADL